MKPTDLSGGSNSVPKAVNVFLLSNPHPAAIAASQGTLESKALSHDGENVTATSILDQRKSTLGHRFPVASCSNASRIRFLLVSMTVTLVRVCSARSALVATGEKR